uniref:Uncharacterized protein n=1 Tax=Arundo donax TaxID=35708 RepID=A0A0A9E4B7_ARUDO
MQSSTPFQNVGDNTISRTAAPVSVLDNLDLLQSSLVNRHFTTSLCLYILSKVRNDVEY